MTADDFRRLAASLPGAAEGAHQGKADFRVGGRVFASLEPQARRGTVKLGPDEQAVLTAAEPAVFTPAPGAWGRQGWTRIALAAADEPTLRDALHRAWRNVAPSAARR